MTLETPFGDEKLEEIRLGAAPLARVVAQLRFPALSRMKDDDIAQDFVRQMSKEYPLMDVVQEISLVSMIPDQQPPTLSQVWRLQTSDENWIVSLGRTSLSLEVIKYSSRTDFNARFNRIVDAFIQIASPPRLDRLGIRYINRIVDSDILGDIPNLIRAELNGLSTLQLPVGVEANHSILEVQFNRGGCTTLARCGYLPPHVIIDPALPPVDKRSWVLDIDSAFVGAGEIAPENIESMIEILTGYNYRFFRYAVKPGFIELFEPER